eukprot:1994030-Pleurochrysis_carterae.AAC.1
MSVLLPRTGLQSRAVVGGTPDEADGSAPVLDGQCDRPPSTPQRRTLTHAAFAQLTLLHRRRLRAVVLPGPCRSPAPCVLDSTPSLASRSRPAACKQGSSRLQGPRTTQLTKEVSSPQTSPPRVEPSMGHAPLFPSESALLACN